MRHGVAPRTLLAGLLVVAALLGACAPSGGTALVDDRASVRRAGVLGPLNPDTLIPIGQALAAHATVYTVPGKPYARTVRFTLTEPGTSLDLARIKPTAEMLCHPGDVIDGTIGRDGADTYLATLPMYQAGLWRIRIDVASPAGSGRIELEMDILD